MKISTQLTCIACMAAATSGAHAEGTDGGIHPDDVIVVTATRTPVSSQRVIAPVDVIDGATIERSMAVELTELLRFQGGLDVVRTGGPGQQTSIFTRGTNSNHTLVLVDGVRMNSGGLGLAAVQNITPEMIERVEIVKAPRTTLYGENAIGGVINVITKTPEGTEIAAYGGAGQDRTLKLGGAAGGRIGGLNVSGRVQRIETDGYPIVEGADFDSGWDNTTFEGKAGYDADRWGLQGRVWYSDGTDEYVAFPIVPASQDYKNGIVALAARAKFNSNWESVVDVSFNVDDISQRESTDFAKTERTIIDWQNTIDVGGHHTVVAGAFLMNEEVAGQSFGSPLIAEDTDTVAVFAEDTLEYGRNMIVVAGRYSDHDAIGRDFTWNFEYGFDLTDAMRLTANAGRAVRAPSAAERFGAFGGNPDLEEEEATTIQGGWRWNFATGQNVSVDLFHTKIDNLIGSDENFQLQNIDRAEITGIEAGYSYSRLAWSINATGVLQNPENATTGELLLRRSEESATLSVARNFGRHQAGADVRLVGPRRDFGDQKLAGYGLVNLTGRLIVTDQLGIYARIENLFDRDYTPAYYDFGVRYLAPSRGAYLELRYRMN